MAIPRLKGKSSNNETPEAKARSKENFKAAVDAENGQQAPLHTLYRPQALDQVIGQDSVVKSLSKVLASKNVPHAYLFTGPSGTGKTTLARIIAREMGIPDKGVLEIDAASNSGIADMRAVVDNVRYKALSDTGRKFVIVDEAHSLSKATWQSLLKPIEEPPEHVYWALCTTEPDKVPDTVRSRCTAYNLKSVSEDDLQALIEYVASEEKMKLGADLVGLIARQAGGSARKALVFLSQVQGVTDKKEAARLIENGVGDEEQAIALARMICGHKGFTWEAAAKIIAALDGESPEGLRLMIVNYAAAVLKNTRDPQPLLAVLDAFRGPYNSSEKMAPLYLSIGSLLYN